jgi:hypothetical protein
MAIIYKGGGSLVSILTPKTGPDHHVVGRHFEGPCFRCDAGKHVFYCDSYDSRIGFWMTRADCPADHAQDVDGEWRRNVSERAIGRTFHRIYNDGPEHGQPMSAWGIVDRALLTIPPQGT